MTARSNPDMLLARVRAELRAAEETFAEMNAADSDAIDAVCGVGFYFRNLGRCSSAVQEVRARYRTHAKGPGARPRPGS